MKSGRILLFFLLSLLFLVSGCRDQNQTRDQAPKKGDYSTVSNLIADRNRGRQDGSNTPSNRKNTPTKRIPDKNSAQASREDELASVILYEQKIRIVGSESGRTLADGVAYINKKGQIVRIAISKDQR